MMLKIQPCIALDMLEACQSTSARSTHVKHNQPAMKRRECLLFLAASNPGTAGQGVAHLQWHGPQSSR